MENNSLLKLVKEKCYITDSIDEKSKNVIDNKVNNLIEDAKIKVAEMIGLKHNFDFSKAGLARDLFLNYCFYAWNDVANEFKNNYLKDIMTARFYYGINKDDKQEAN